MTKELPKCYDVLPNCYIVSSTVFIVTIALCILWDKVSI